MTYTPLLGPRTEGYRVGVLFSSEMAVDIFRNIGFQEYGQGNIYMWQPGGTPYKAGTATQPFRRLAGQDGVKATSREVDPGGARLSPIAEV